MARSKSAPSLAAIDPIDEDDNVLAVIETPRGTRTKLTYDEKLGAFAVTKVLPQGMTFPFDFGFIPSTKGGDDDPVDVLVLMDEALPTGTVVATRLVGVIEAEQTERDGSVERNDRLIGVAVKSRLYENVESLKELNDTLVDEIEHFFVSYNEAKGKIFAPQKRSGPKRADSLVREGEGRFKAAHRKKKRR